MNTDFLTSRIRDLKKFIADDQKELVKVEAELKVAEDLQAAESWPLWHFYKDRVLDLLKKDSDRVAIAKTADWNRPYEYTLKSAYDHVVASDKAEQQKRRDEALRTYQMHYWRPVLNMMPGCWIAEAAKPTKYFPGARVNYRPNARKGVLWTGTVIVRPEGYCFPSHSLVTHGELTYVIKDGTICIRGCFAKNLEPAK